MQLSIHKSLECTLIGPFVDILTTRGASEISFCFFKVMLADWLLVLLLFQQLGHNLRSCDLLLDRLVWAVLFRVHFIELDLWTGLRQPVFYGGSRESLRNPLTTSSALVAAPMRLPSVVWSLPRFAAVLDQLLFVLLFVVLDAGVPFGAGSAPCQRTLKPVCLLHACRCSHDPYQVFLQVLVEVLVLVTVFGICPSFPDCSNLDNDFNSRAGVLG